MVLSIDDSNELVKVQMNSNKNFTTSVLSGVRFQSLIEVNNNYHFPAPNGDENVITAVQGTGTDDDDDESDESDDDSDSDSDDDTVDEGELNDGEVNDAIVPTTTTTTTTTTSSNNHNHTYYQMVHLPPLDIWTPFNHSTFPLSFQAALKYVVLGNQYGTIKLPTHMWMHIFSFIPRCNM